MIKGWPIVAWAAVAVAAMVAAILVWVGDYDVSLPMATRATGRTSLAFFLAAFMASTLYRILPAGRGRWLLKNRRYLGVSFAASHAIHAVLLTATINRLQLDYSPITLAGGGLGYVFIAAMAATSFDRTAAWLGRKRWRLLHSVGAYALWGIFVVTYLGEAGEHPLHAVLLGLLVVCLLLKLGVRFAVKPGVKPPEVPARG